MIESEGEILEVVFMSECSVVCARKCRYRLNVEKEYFVNQGNAQLRRYDIVACEKGFNFDRQSILSIYTYLYLCPKSINRFLVGKGTVHAPFVSVVRYTLAFRVFLENH